MSIYLRLGNTIQLLYATEYKKNSDVILLPATGGLPFGCTK